VRQLTQPLEREIENAMPRVNQGRPNSKSILRYLSKLKQSALSIQGFNALLFTHRQADPDALCSAYSISSFLLSGNESNSGSAASKFRPTCKIIAPKGASTLGTSVCKSLSIAFQEEVSDQEIENANLIVLLDVGSPKLVEPYLGNISKSRALKLLLDHHSSTLNGQESENHKSPSFEFLDRIFVDQRATSTCEILALEYPKQMLDLRTSLVLLVGLLFDSQHLGIATSSTLEAALKLVKIGGARIDEAKELLRSRPDRSEIIARLKSAQRLRFEQAGNYLLSQSEVSSFQASVARMLVDLGADVGVAYGEQGNEGRVSVRSSQRFFRETSVDLGSLLGNLSKELVLTGGGHSTAASISGDKRASEIAQKVLLAIKSKIP
jgi:nanoRNase/pAp phosphatase (c-di-AMP/oligoRNAs hydrolase)